MQKEILKNGLKVILAPNNATKVVTIMTMFGVGSRYESEENAGISHVLEHMHYKGTKKRPTFIEVAEFIESIGGEHNAFTGKEYTGYYVKVAPKHLRDAFDFLSDIVINSVMKEEELAREKNVIIEEINMYEDSPSEMVDSKFEESLFGNNSLGRDIIGYKQTVSGVSSKSLQDYKSSYYTGPNTIIVIAGNFGQYSREDLMAMIEEMFPLPSSTPIDLPPLIVNQAKSHLICSKKTEQSHMVIGFHGPAYAHPDRYKLKLLGVILGGGMSSRMFAEIREKRGLAYAVRTSVSGYSDAGSIETQVGVPHDKVGETVRAVISEYAKIRDGGVTEVELARAKEMISGRVLISFEDSLDLATHYAISEIVANQTLTPEEILERYEKVTVKDITEVAKKYILDNRMSLAYIGPALKEKDLNQIFKI
ncbi:MAG: pitrilysin family protein [Patescibacteria group bacterium]|jgi:predicted Zn-dependent peptidase